eukprot:9048388-Ditylum_brightwellii.AAC.1
MVILDSGFCVLQTIISLKTHGVYASALIKKRCYWPKHINGPGIQSFSEDTAIGYHARLPGVLDGAGFDIFGLKEPEYTVVVMSTYGQLTVTEGQKDSMRNLGTGSDEITFKYTVMFSNHFQYCGAIDDHNSKRYDGCDGCHMSLETTWKTTRWELGVFEFILAVCE